MGHALEKIHRLLKPGGALIDIHPTPEPAALEVRSGAQATPAGWMQETDDYTGYEQADAALAQAIKRGLFIVERQGRFEFVVYADSTQELREEYLSDFWEQAYIDDITLARLDEMLSTPERDKEIILRESIRIARLRKNTTGASPPSRV
jgi:hypothetical protein